VSERIQLVVQCAGKAVWLSVSRQRAVRCCVGGTGRLVPWGHGLRAPNWQACILHARKKGDRVRPLLNGGFAPLMLLEMRVAKRSLQRSNWFNLRVYCAVVRFLAFSLFDATEVCDFNLIWTLAKASVSCLPFFSDDEHFALRCWLHHEFAQKFAKIMTDNAPKFATIITENPCHSSIASLLLSRALA
jgi:hypothetical protein